MCLKEQLFDICVILNLYQKDVNDESFIINFIELIILKYYFLYYFLYYLV